MSFKEIHNWLALQNSGFVVEYRMFCNDQPAKKIPKRVQLVVSQLQENKTTAATKEITTQI